jgi:hypothetical protein
MISCWKLSFWTSWKEKLASVLGCMKKISTKNRNICTQYYFLTYFNTYLKLWLNLYHWLGYQCNKLSWLLDIYPQKLRIYNNHRSPIGRIMKISWVEQFISRKNAYQCRGRLMHSDGLQHLRARWAKINCTKYFLYNWFLHIQ